MAAIAAGSRRYLFAGIVLVAFVSSSMFGVGRVLAANPDPGTPTPTLPAQGRESQEIPPPSGDTHGPTVSPYSDKAIVLLYHHIDPVAKSGSTITPADFRAQMEFLKQDGFSVISLKHLESYLEGGQPLPPKAVVITFDDGYESFYQYAFPILKEFQFPATCFVVVSSVGNTPPGGSLRHMTWDEMKFMQTSGLATFESHTYDLHRYVSVANDKRTHPALVSHVVLPWTGASETEEEYRALIAGDLLLSKRLMEQNLGVPVNFLAFPYGASNPVTLDLARRVGYKWFFGVTPGAVEQKGAHEVLRRVNGGNPHITVAVLAAAIQDAVDREEKPETPPVPTSQAAALSPASSKKPSLSKGSPK